MSIIKQYHKDSGITYVYSSESYWDKEKKQPRSRRKLIGKLDDETGEIIPTGKKGRKSRKEDRQDTEKLLDTQDSGNCALYQKLSCLEEENRSLRERGDALEAENRKLTDTLAKIQELTRKIGYPKE